jgi:hypothetical protein
MGAKRRPRNRCSPLYPKEYGADHITWAVGTNAAAKIAILGVLLRGHAP